MTARSARAAAWSVAAVMLVVLATPAGAGAAPSPGPVDVRRDIPYTTAGGETLRLDAYVPAATGGARPAVLLIHGGEFRTGDKASFEPEARKIAARGWVAFSINYRLDVTPAFPAELDDAQAAVRWVRANATQYEVDPERIGVLGESAGGTLAGLLATSGRGSRTTGARVRVAVSWSGPMDLVALAKEQGDAWARGLMGCTVAECPEQFRAASPIDLLDKTDTATYLVNSKNEIVPISQLETMASKMEDLSVPLQARRIDGSQHALDYRDLVWASTDAWLASYLAPPGETSSGSVVFVAVLLVIALGGGVLFMRRSGRKGRVIA